MRLVSNKQKKSSWLDPTWGWASQGFLEAPSWCSCSWFLAPPWGAALHPVPLELLLHFENCPVPSPLPADPFPLVRKWLPIAQLKNESLEGWRETRWWRKLPQLVPSTYLCFHVYQATQLRIEHYFSLQSILWDSLKSGHTSWKQLFF